MASIHMTAKAFCLSAGKQTTIALEPCFWEAFQDICQWEGKSLAAMVREVEGLKAKDYPITGAIRLFVLKYHRSEGAAPRKMPVVKHNLAREIGQTRTSSAGGSGVKSELARQ